MPVCRPTRSHVVMYSQRGSVAWNALTRARSAAAAASRAAASSASAARCSASACSAVAFSSSASRWKIGIVPPRPTARILAARPTELKAVGEAALLPLEEATDCGLRLLAEHRQGEPVAGMADCLVPGEVAPPVELLLRVAGRLRELAGELLDPLVDDRVELVRRDGAVDEPPLGRLGGRDLVAEEDDLAGAAVADHDRQPLRRTAGRHRAVLE